jgi:hypothetical protein
MKGKICNVFSSMRKEQIKKQLCVLAVFLLLGIGSMSYAIPYFVTEDLSSNRYNQLSLDTLQVVIFYDGYTYNNPRLEIELYNATLNSYYYITVSNIDKFTTEIETRQYHLDGYQPTGNIRVFGVVGDGAIDGLACGLFWKNSAGDYYVAKSRSYPPFNSNPGANFVGAWPIGYSSAWFASALTQITDNYGKEQATMAIYGAQLLDNGVYDIL